MAPRVEFPDFPDEVQHNWHWIAAIYAWDRDDPEPLSKHLRENEPPDAIRLSIEKRLSGKVKPRKKAAPKLKIRPADRMWLAARYSVEIYIRSKANESGVGLYGDGRTFLEGRADDLGIEIIQLKRSMQRDQRRAQENVASRFGISVETLENILRDMGRLARSYPDL